MLRTALAALALGFTAMPVLAQAPANSTADPVAAVVNGTEIRRSAIEKARQSVPQLAQMPLDKIYTMMLDKLIQEQLFVQAGRKDNLQNDPEVKERLKELEGRVIAQIYINRVVRKAVTEQALAKRYEKFKAEAPTGEEVRASHILLDSESKAKDVLAELKKGGDFAAIAKAKSIDPGAQSGGDLGYFRQEEMVPEFAEAAFKMKPGQITETPIKTQFGWHVIKVVDRRAAKPPSFDDMKEELSIELSQDAVAALVETLSAKAKIARFDLNGNPIAEPKPEPKPNSGKK
ncbi:MAG: peptidyl-prolyl cis-trans isomerase [Rhodospirillales bacterium]|nr:peptidyl-prolyl cis-trans isomerase [Rhodospirillales bacterium]